MRIDGDWEGWLDFFLDGVATIADEAVAATPGACSRSSRGSRSPARPAGVSVSTLRLFEPLPRHPVVTVASVMKLLETTKPTAASAIAGLEKAGILSETTGRQRDRVFAYASYLKRLRSGTDLAR